MEKKRLEIMFRLFNLLMFFITVSVAIISIAVFVLALAVLVTAIADGFMQIRPKDVSEVNSAKLSVSEGKESYGLIKGFQSLELFLLAPLPFVLVVGLWRYLDALAHGRSPKKAKAELLDYKSFEVALFIAVIAAVLIVRIIQPKPGDFPTEFLVAALLLMAILVGLLWILEHFGEKAAAAEAESPEEIQMTVANAEIALSLGEYEDAERLFVEARKEYIRLYGPEVFEGWMCELKAAYCAFLIISAKEKAEIPEDEKQQISKEKEQTVRRIHVAVDMLWDMGKATIEQKKDHTKVHSAEQFKNHEHVIKFIIKECKLEKAFPEFFPKSSSRPKQNRSGHTKSSSPPEQNKSGDTRAVVESTPPPGTDLDG